MKTKLRVHSLTRSVMALFAPIKGEVLGKYNEEVLAERELAKNPEIVRFIRAYNKMAKQKGFDISKIYNTKTDNKKNS